MTSASQIALVMMNVLKVVPNNTMVIHAKVGSVKAGINDRFQ